MILTPQKLIWKKAPFSSEKGVFLEYAEQIVPTYLGGKRLLPSERSRMVRETLKRLEHAYGLATPTTLPESVWRRLDNTDSWWTMTPGEVEKAIRDKQYKNGPRDVSIVIDEFNTGKIRCPIILVPQKDDYRLLAGNVRMMVARVSGVIPKCVFLDLNR